MYNSTKILLTLLAFILISCAPEKQYRKIEPKFKVAAPAIPTTEERLRPLLSERFENKVLVMLPLSGSNAELGKGILDAIALAVHESENENTDFEVIDTENPANSKIKLYDRFKNNAPIAIIGPVFYGEARQLGSLFPNVPIFTLSNNPKVNNDHVFSCSISPMDEIRSIFSYLKSAKINGLLAFIPSGEVGDQLANYMKQEMQYRGFAQEYLEVIRYERIAPQDALNLATNSSKKAIFAIEPIFDFQKIPEKKLVTLGSAVQLNPSAWIGAIYAFTNSREFSDFSRNYRGRFHKSPLMIESAAYDIANAILTAIDRHEFDVENEEEEKKQNISMFLGRYRGCLGNFAIRKNHGCIRRLSMTTVTE